MPDSIRADTGGVLKLELSVWGSGGPIAGRYTDVVAYYRLVGQDIYTSSPAKRISQDNEREVYEFRIPPFPKGTTGELEYYFELKLDGHPSQVKGAKRIKVQDAP